MEDVPAAVPAGPDMPVGVPVVDYMAVVVPAVAERSQTPSAFPPELPTVALLPTKPVAPPANLPSTPSVILPLMTTVPDAQ